MRRARCAKRSPRSQRRSRPASGIKVRTKYGPSGTLRDEIAGGAKAEVFASANMAHPESLAKARKSAPVMLFARNRLCALVRPGLAVTSENLLDSMLRDDVKVGTSTPKADPSGDYAFEVFARAEALKAGSRAALEQKALQLTGGASERAAARRPQRLWHGTSRKAAPISSSPIATGSAQRISRAADHRASRR